jgi:hypothetical protein
MEPIFIQIDADELRRRLQAAATGDPALAHDFFAHFPFIAYYKRKEYLSAFNSAIDTMTELKGLDVQAYKRIHKGYIFYFLAISTFLLHDFQSAGFFFDAAASEDIKNDPNPRTPALLFMILDSQNPNQAAQELTKIAEDWLRTMVSEYNLCSGSVALTVQEVRQHFLVHSITDHREWRTLVTSWISFLLEWSHRFHILNLRVEDGTWEPFYLHLFKGCLLFESLLKSEPSGQAVENTLGQILNTPTSYVCARLGITRRIRTGNSTLSDILRDASTAAPDIVTDMEFTARLRNTVGHNLSWGTRINLNEYSLLAKKISNSCLHAISTMYR